eukprot:m.50899 g.50899  ORF g.50899 m.50899 type:complete len:356 (+) comp7270_c1_seq2:196-1263(+)
MVPHAHIHYPHIHTRFRTRRTCMVICSLICVAWRPRLSVPTQRTNRHTTAITPRSSLPTWSSHKCNWKLRETGHSMADAISVSTARTTTATTAAPTEPTGATVVTLVDPQSSVLRKWDGRICRHGWVGWVAAGRATVNPHPNGIAGGMRWRKRRANHPFPMEGFGTRQRRTGTAVTGAMLRVMVARGVWCNRLNGSIRHVRTTRFSARWRCMERTALPTVQVWDLNATRRLPAGLSAFTHRWLVPTQGSKAELSRACLCLTLNRHGMLHLHPRIPPRGAAPTSKANTSILICFYVVPLGGWSGGIQYVPALSTTCSLHIKPLFFCFFFCCCCRSSAGTWCIQNARNMFKLFQDVC